MRISRITCLCLALWTSPLAAEDQPAKGPVSYQKDIRPLVQAHCQGCHQPAKRGGGYDMTSYSNLMKAGESGLPPIVPGKPDESYLVAQITPESGQAEMPKKSKPLHELEIANIRRWIAEGAVDDSTAVAAPAYDQNHLPVYSQPPVITSLAFSPDGELLAISGFHEILLRSSDGKKLIGRLVGLAERIESVAFSPDGKRLAASGGQPGRMGELQIWDVASQKLLHSIPLSSDTLYGASWSPDGKLVAVGCTDSSVRAFDTATGEQVFFNAAHDDWPLATVFSVDGKLLVSAGRDMSTKLYNVPTQRFIDNVTSITPGALKGGLSALQRHPQRNEILVGGADGTPRVYRMERVSARKIGDDANLMRSFSPMQGRIYGVAYAPDGLSAVCGASLDGNGQVFTYNTGPVPAAPPEIQKILEKMEAGPSKEELDQLQAYYKANPQVLELTKTDVPSSVYAVAFHPKQPLVVAAGGDGRIRVISTRDGKVVDEFLPVEITKPSQADAAQLTKLEVRHQDKLSGAESLPPNSVMTGLDVSPTTIDLQSPFASSQLLVTGILQSGDRVDLTRLATLDVKGNAARVSPLGRVFPLADGTATIHINYEGHQVAVPVKVSRFQNPEPMNFIRDVNPVMTRLGCNQGTCHGSKDGKNGFKLSLRGYDPVYDVRALTDDLKSRRTNVAAPDSSLMLLKASGSVPHVGGQVTRPGEAYYEIIRRWIAEGAHLNFDVERVASIRIEPHNPVVQSIGARQQLRVVATYTNGKSRDVTGEAFLESGNTEVAETNRAAVMTALRRGEAPILARFEGNYAATTLTAMGDRSGFVWQSPEKWTHIDELVAQKWERMKIQPSETCNDVDFLRRVSLDLTGLPPSADAVVAFANDSRPLREKRDAVIDQFIGSDAYIEFWTNKWADLLQVNSKYLGTQGASEFRNWIRKKVASNEPYDKFCYEVLTASGSNKSHPAASYYKILREPTAIMENTTQLFLAIRFNCNKCHDHPFERWTQDQYYQTAAYFARVGLKRDPDNPDGNIGGTAVEGAKPLWEEIFDKPNGEITHDRTGAVTPPLVPFDRKIPAVPDHNRREQLADWITSAENDYFARSYVNRVWGYLMGVGLIEPIDDIRAGNPATNPELLDFLTADFIQSGFDVRRLMSNICKSRVYQLSIDTNRWNEDDRQNYSHAFPKRLPAEVLYDTVYTVTGAKMEIPGVPPGTRAAALPDVQISLTDGFLDNLGRPVRESACECERSSGLQLGSVMALMNGSTVSQAISQPGNQLEQLVKSESDNSRLIDRVFLQILNRHARPQEIQATLALMEELDPELKQLIADRDSYRDKIAPVLKQKAEKQKQAIADTERELAAYTVQIRPKVDADEKARVDRIAAAQQALDAYNAGAPERLAAWSKSDILKQTPWTRLKFTSLKTTNKSKLEQGDDASILASGPNGKGEYILQTTATLKQLGAIFLEALSDDKLPGKGPGRGRGNFVLTEFVMEVWPKDHPEKKQQIQLKEAKASFSQAGYDVATAIDGKVAPAGNGWAISPQIGKDQHAFFHLAEPLNVEGELIVQFRLNQQYQDNKHTLGKFRVSLTDETGEVNTGVPAAIIDLVKIPADKRTAEQTAKLVAYMHESDKEFAKLTAALAAAQKPVPVDPHLVELRERLEEYKKPLPPDPQLSRLERAVELGETQIKDRRLTTIQDLAWALINSSAFLFNR